MKIITVVDFETTRPEPRRPAQPWQIGIAQLADGEVVPDSLWHSYLRVDADVRYHRDIMPNRAEREIIASAPEFHEVLPTLLANQLAYPLAAHNASVERTILRRAAPLHDFSEWIDTLELARLCYPGMTSYALNDVIIALGLEVPLEKLCPGLCAHHALRDAVACALLLGLMHKEFSVLNHWEAT